MIANNNFSQADLISMTEEIYNFIINDSAEFNARGVTNAEIDDYKAMIDYYKSILQDDYYLYETQISVIEKKDKRKELEIIIKRLSGFIIQAYGRNSAEYDSLDLKMYRNITDAKFIRVCRNLANRLEEYFSEISQYGITQAMIDNLKSETNNLVTIMDDIVQKKEIRRKKTKERIEKGNELYTRTAQLAMVGKMIWDGVNNSKYKVYLLSRYLRKSSKKKKKEAENVENSENKMD